MISDDEIGGKDMIQISWTSILGLLAVALLLLGVNGYAQSHTAEEQHGQELHHFHNHQI